MGNHKICFIASSGGHLEEISRLRKIEKEFDNILVTEKSDFTVNNFGRKQYFVSKMNRKQITFLPKFIRLFLQAKSILDKEKPDIIITTGALVSYPFCVLARYKGIKIIYIESFARVQTPSLTGRLLYNFADLFIVQWEDALELYPKSVLGGGIF